MNGIDRNSGRFALVKKIYGDPVWRLLFLFFLALVVRIFVVFSLDYHFYEAKAKDPYKDAVQYHQLALSLLDGDGMMSGDKGHRVLDLKRPPFYPLFLAGVYSVFGTDISLVQLVQAVIGALTVLLFYLLCLEYSSGRISFVASLVFALYLPHAALSVAIMTEVWTTFLITSTLLCFSRACRAESAHYWLLTGLSYACLMLNRQFYKYALIFIILAVGALYWKERRKLARNMIAFAIPLVMLVGPWMHYTRSVTGEPVFDTFGISPLDYLQMNMLLMEERWGYYDTPEKKELMEKQIGEIYYEHDLGKTIKSTLRLIGEKPRTFVKTTFYNAQTLWLRSFFVSEGNRGNLLYDTSPLMKKKYLYDQNYPILLLNAVTAVFAFAGLAGLLRFGVNTVPLAFGLLITIVPFTFFFFPSERYGQVVHNIIIFYAVMAIAWTYSMVKAKAHAP